MATVKIKCPVCKGNGEYCVACKGSGKIKPPKPKNYIKDNEGQMKKAAHALRKTGYTLREIATILGYKNPQSIAHLLNKK